MFLSKRRILTALTVRCSDLAISLSERVPKALSSIGNQGFRRGLFLGMRDFQQWRNKRTWFCYSARRQTATFAALATCASETVPALAKSQTAAAEMMPDSLPESVLHFTSHPLL